MLRERSWLWLAGLFVPAAAIVLLAVVFLTSGSGTKHESTLARYYEIPEESFQSVNQTQVAGDFSLTLTDAAFTSDESLLLFEAEYDGAEARVIIPGEEITVAGIEETPPPVQRSALPGLVALGMGPLDRAGTSLRIEIPILFLGRDRRYERVDGPWVFEFVPNG